MRGKGPLGRHGTPDRVACALKGNQKAVALILELTATGRSDRRPKQTSVILEDLQRLSIAKVLEKTRRSLDVSEEECDGAGWKVPWFFLPHGGGVTCSS